MTIIIYNPNTKTVLIDKLATSNNNKYKVNKFKVFKDSKWTYKGKVTDTTVYLMTGNLWLCEALVNLDRNKQPIDDATLNSYEATVIKFRNGVMSIYDNSNLKQNSLVTDEPIVWGSGEQYAMGAIEMLKITNPNLKDFLGTFFLKKVYDVVSYLDPFCGKGYEIINVNTGEIMESC